MNDDFRSCWGKARAELGSATQWHPIAHHSLDVAAVAGEMLSVRPIALARAARLLNLTENDARRLLVALVALHDIGKFAPAFQMKSPNQWPSGVYGPLSSARFVDGHHTVDGFVLWIDELVSSSTRRIWSGGDCFLRLIAPAIFGHHGRPVAGADRTTAIARFQIREALSAARSCAECLLSLLMPAPIVSAPPSPAVASNASWWISGLVTAADWVGSSQRWFPYTEPIDGDSSLQRYWERAKSQAEDAVREAGLRPPKAARQKSLQELTGAALSPTPAQQWAASVPIPSGATLFILEEVTGAGKTEAAQIFVNRLMAAGRSAGAYWAMPTQATANAMYGRQASILDRLFDDESRRPSLVLSHGQQHLHPVFRSSVLPGADDGQMNSSSSNESDDDDVPSTSICAAWLADDRRAAMLADVGAGTIDQALLGILPSKFNTMRLFGLADRVLVIDEAHAYDTYMSVELEELLRFQAALGGNAVVLSATLPLARRTAIANAWHDGIRGGRRHTDSARVPESDAYPLGTVISASDTIETPLSPAQLGRRAVPVRFVHSADEAAQHVATAARLGAAVAWIRNTVGDCLAAAALLRNVHGLDVLVFHARFAQCDRQQRENEVLRRFGKESDGNSGRHCVVVSTQVIEQSLDLDFDAMVTDIAPIDLIVQRAGRLWRHERSSDRPAGLERVLVVLAPIPQDEPAQDWLGEEFDGTRHVYKHAGVLWRTVRTLSQLQVIDTPSGLRGMIESVYGAEAAEIPASLVSQVNQAEGKAKADAAVATFATLKVGDGYNASAHAWVSEVRARTRLNDDQTVVRLARVRGDGRLVPWENTAMNEPWKAWALSEVRLSARKVPTSVTGELQFQSAIAAAKTEWGRFEQEIPVLPLREDGSGWIGRLTRDDGRPVLIRYSIAEGLAYERNAD